MHDVAVYTESLHVWPKHVEYAAAVAASFNARLTGLCVCPSPDMVMPSYDARGFVVEWIDQVRQLTDEACKAEADFLAEAQRHHVEKASWQVALGYVPECVALASSWNDVMVLGCDAAVAWGSPAAIGNIMLGCEAPCLIVPASCEKPFALDNVVIAWNGSMAALRALRLALPLLMRAQRICVLESSDLSSPMDLWLPKFDLTRYLSQLGVDVQPCGIVPSGEGIGRDLLHVAAQANADLLIMGGYGHTRLRERILGGATREVLEQTRMPIWMHH